MKLMSNDYSNILLEATKAANEAGDAWVAAHTRPAFAVMDGNRCVGQLLDVCGFGYVQVDDKRTGFAKWLKKVQDGYNSVVRLNTKYRMRQELGLNEATAYAACAVFQKYGVKGVSVYSRID